MPRKGENIFKRKDGRWEGRYIKSRSLTGKAIYGYVYAKTYRETKRKLAEATISGGKSVVSAGNSSVELFETAALEWFEAINPSVKESTSNKYKNLLKLYILPEIGTFPITGISQDLIENYCNTLMLSGGIKKTGLSPKTISDILSVIRSILHYCVGKRKIGSCDTLTIQLKQRPKEMRVLSRREQERLCRYLYSNLDGANIGILMCLFTGIRIGEICALRWEDISLTDHTIHVHQTLQRIQDRTGRERKTKVVITEPKSACSVRTIPIPNELLNVIVSYQATTAGYFLTNSDSKRIEPRTMQNRFKKALEKSDIDPVNYHTLRHTFATRCIELGFDVKSLSEILGHASVNITMNRYVHPSMELKKENMQRLSSLFTVK